MEIVSWKTGVNRIVTSEASINIGQNAVSSDNSENGSEQSRLNSSGSPDRYQVSMYFSNSTENLFYSKYGKTEWQAFLDWFKYETKFGTLPFYFTSLQDASGEKTDIYKISTSGLPAGSPIGDYIKCTMTWIQVFNDFININETETTADYISALNGSIDFVFLEHPTEDITKSLFTATYSVLNNGDYTDEAELVIENIAYDGYKTCVLYFQEFNIPGIYKINVSFNKSTPVSDTIKVE